MDRKDEMMEASSEAQSRVLSEAVAHVAALWSTILIQAAPIDRAQRLPEKAHPA